MHDTNLRRNPYLETGLRLPKAFQLGYSHAQFHNCSLDPALSMNKEHPNRTNSKEEMRSTLPREKIECMRKKIRRFHYLKLGVNKRCRNERGYKAFKQKGNHQVGMEDEGDECFDERG